MDQCRQKCWITGGLVGLAVLLVTWAGGSGLVAAVLLGLLTAGLLGGLLVWGLCEGRGTAAENDALMGAYWEPEPFTPSRRVVAAGGRVVSQAPLSNDAPEGLAGTAPLQRVTLQASRDPLLSHPVPPAPAPEPSPEPPADIRPPAETVALLATPSVASVIPVEPLALPRLTQAVESARPPEAPPTAARPTEAGSPAARGIALGEDRVATLTDPLPAANGRQGSIADFLPADEADDDVELRRDAAAAGLAVHDPLLRIDGVGPIQARWLRDSGVTSLQQIARWDDSDIARFAGMMGREGHRIRSQDWAGQAARLTGGGR